MERVDGLTILRMCKAKSFKEGDIVIAFQEDDSGNECTSVYRFEEGDFTDLETRDCIDLFDLVECSFLVVQPRQLTDIDLALKRFAKAMSKISYY